MYNNPWIIGLKSARANLVPGLCLQAMALALLGGYYCVPSMRFALERVSEWQQRFGVFFSLSSYLFFCGIIPYLFCMAMPSLRPAKPGRALLFALGLWGLLGLLLPRFYAFLIVLYGNAADFRTLTLKIITDQCGYTALFASPTVALAHLWKEHDYRWSRVAPHLGRGWYQRLVLPNLVMNWTIWIPSLCVIYSLPATLQSHVAGLIGGFWALMCLQIAARTKLTPSI